MQTQNQDYVKCKYCKERVHIPQMYAHTLECNSSNHPNFNSQMKSVVKSSQSHLQQQSVPIQETNLQQSSSKLPVEFVESFIQFSTSQSEIQQQQSVNNGSHSNLPQQNNKQEIQKLNKQNSNVYTESLLKQAQKKCEYCDEVYPIQILEQHYPFCEAKLLIESLSLAEEQEQNNHYQSQNHQDYQDEQDSQDNQDVQDDQDNQDNQDDQDSLDSQDNEHQNYPQQYEESSDSSQNEGSHYITGIREELLPDGSIFKTITTTNFNTGEVITRTETIHRPQQQQQQPQPQQFPQVPFHRSFESQNEGVNFFHSFDSIFGTNVFPNQQRSIFQPMANSTFMHQVPEELQNLAVIKYTPYDGLAQEYKQCTICFTDYEDGEELILLPCIHRFHKTCISQWFKEMTTCPICKTDVAEQEMAFEEDDQL
ncbi:unnamed protein product [Paramecium octaurelia]|uniref:RING-type domain-containing protein n=1 Tax=Paramecium octaurelia TaxID=43137 RepID=A0A8S1V871_PAROT|nr:unnamed protein product [Paramecium octaurelia]